MNSDFKELLKIFAEEKVKYLIIGGYAVAKHADRAIQKTSIFGSTIQVKMPDEFFRL